MFGVNNGRILKDYIDAEELVIPSIVLAEVARKYVVKRLNFGTR